MGRGSWNKRGHVVPNAHQAMDNFKYEIAAELGLPVRQGSEDYWGDLSSRDCGAVGGNMVRRMIQFAESQLANGGSLGVTGGTTGGTTGGATGGMTGGTTTGSTGGMTGGTTGGMTGGTTGGTRQPESSYARGTTFNSNNDRSRTGGTTGGTTTIGTTSTGRTTGTITGQPESSYARGTTFNSNNDRTRS